MAVTSKKYANSKAIFGMPCYFLNITKYQNISFITKRPPNMEFQKSQEVFWFL